MRSSGSIWPIASRWWSSPITTRRCWRARPTAAGCGIWVRRWTGRASVPRAMPAPATTSEPNTPRAAPTGDRATAQTRHRPRSLQVTHPRPRRTRTRRPATGQEHHPHRRRESHEHLPQQTAQDRNAAPSPTTTSPSATAHGSKRLEYAKQGLVDRAVYIGYGGMNRGTFACRPCRFARCAGIAHEFR